MFPALFYDSGTGVSPVCLLHPSHGRHARYVFSVAQIVNLPYRRLPIGRTLPKFTGSGQGAVLQDGILRYSRLAVCATKSAEAPNTYDARATTLEAPWPPQFLCLSACRAREWLTSLNAREEFVS